TDFTEPLTVPSVAVDGLDDRTEMHAAWPALSKRTSTLAPRIPGSEVSCPSKKQVRDGDRVIFFAPCSETNSTSCVFWSPLPEEDDRSHPSALLPAGSPAQFRST